MFETTGATTADLKGLVAVLGRVQEDVSNRERVDQLGALERLKAAVAAAQARVTAAFVVEEAQVAAEWRERAREAADANDFEGWRAARDEEGRHTLTGGSSMSRTGGETSVKQPESGPLENGPAGGRPENRSGRWRRVRREDRVGVVAQVGLARRVSPSRAAGLVRTAVTLVEEMPSTLSALERGVLSEWRAELVVRECQVLSAEDRSLVDGELAELCADGVLGRLGDRELARRVRALAYRVDAESVIARCRVAEGERRVTIRPAPDTMCYLTALLPVAQGVAAHAALVREAASAKAAGDLRSRGQVMADTFVARVAGMERTDVVPVELQVVITDRALLAGDSTPAHVPGYGPVPSRWVRDLVTPRDRSALGSRAQHAQPGQATDATSAASRAEPAASRAERPRTADGSYLVDSGEESTRVWVRRLFTHPDDGTLVAMESKRRLFEAGLRRFILARDGTCQTPWCDAPIRHIDHVVDHAAGGPTSAVNGQGGCERCNHAKQAAGWRAFTHGGELPGTRHRGRAGPGAAAPDRAGEQAGARAGARAGKRAGARAGEQAGARAGARAGKRAGAQAGEQAGEQAGARAEGHLEACDWTPHTVVTITPTGHEYQSTAPPVLPGLEPNERHSVLERAYERRLAA